MTIIRKRSTPDQTPLTIIPVISFLLYRYNILNLPSQPKVSKVSKQIEEIIDEKCRYLNKSGTSKGSAIHLAQWMKGQLDSQVAKHTNGLRSGSSAGGDQNHNDNNDDDNGDVDDDDDDATSEEEHIEDWSDAKVRERSKELQLIDENGLCSAPPPSTKPDAATFRRFHHDHHRPATADEATLSEFTEDESKSASKSTTSDSQVSVY